MAEGWTRFGGKEAAAARNKQWEELWEAEENYWGEEEEEEDEEEEERLEEDEEQEEREDEYEDGEWDNMNWPLVEEEDFWEDEREEQEEQERLEEEEPEPEKKVKENVEDEEEDSHLSLEALRVLDRLKVLDCPFLKGLYKTKMKTAKQFLCTPSVYRLDILAWLFTRLYPPFLESFDTWQDSNAEDKIIELTRLGHELMLCGPDDHDLIKGCAQEKQQLCFINELIHLIESLNSEFSDNLSSVNIDICDLMQKKKMMLMKFFNPNMPKETTDPKLKPLTPGVQPHEKKENVGVKPKEVKKTKVEELSEKLTKLTEMLQAHNK